MIATCKRYCLPLLDIGTYGIIESYLSTHNPMDFLTLAGTRPSNYLHENELWKLSFRVSISISFSANSQASMDRLLPADVNSVGHGPRTKKSSTVYLTYIML